MGLGEIRDKIRMIAGADEERLIYCTVKSVEGVLCVCTPIDENEPELLDIRLNAEESDYNFTLIPKVDSSVLVALYNKNSGYIACFGEIETVLIRGEEYGGLVKIEDLVTKLNNLENQINNILTSLKSISVPLAPSGAVPFAPFFASINSLQTTSKSDLENENIKHG